MAAPYNYIQAQGQGSVSADQLNTPTQTALNVAALRAFVALNDMTTLMLGFNSEGDGGQGLFWYSIGSSATDDGGVTCVAPYAAGATGRWLRLPFTAPETSCLSFTINGNGSAIPTGSYVGLFVPFACTITAVTLLADQSTTTEVDIWVTPYGSYPPSITNTITASDIPTITAAEKYQDTTLTGWTTSIPAGSTIWYDVKANNNAEQLTVALSVTKG